MRSHYKAKISLMWFLCKYFTHDKIFFYFLQNIWHHQELSYLNDFSMVSMSADSRQQIYREQTCNKQFIYFFSSILIQQSTQRIKY